MDDLFKKRMSLLLGEKNNVGQVFINETNLAENKTFRNDPNYNRGMLYDWNLNPIEEVDFKFEKHKKYSPGSYEIEYYVRFRPNFNPEFLYKDMYYKKDGKERFGFYLDIYDFSKKKYYKWLIISKDDRSSFDRYIVYKCNWWLEWIYNGKYYKAPAVLRDSDGSNSGLAPQVDSLGGTTINGGLSIYTSKSKDLTKLRLGTRFIISDDEVNPLVYSIYKIKDAVNLGVAKLFVEQDLFNLHKDYFGEIRESDYDRFNFDLPIEDLPYDFGGSYHMICNCLKDDYIDTNIYENIELVSSNDKIYINGDWVTLQAVSPIDEFICQWHIFVDGEEYEISDLTDYFDIEVNKNILKIRSINEVMLNFVVKVAIFNDKHDYDKYIEMEVSF